MIEAFVRAAIETTSDEAAKPRLRRCVPPLLVAVKNWAGSPAGEVVMAAATPKAAFMFVADDWPDIDEGEFQTHEVARALVGAIEFLRAEQERCHSRCDCGLAGRGRLRRAARGAGADCGYRGDPAGGDPGRARWPHRCGNGDGDSDARGDDALKKNPRKPRGLEGCAFEVSPLRGAIPRATPRSRPHAQAHR